MVSHARSTDLLDQTVDTLEQEVSALTPQDGLSLIDQWLEALKDNENTKEIAGLLGQLRNHLQSDQPNLQELLPTLDKLAEKTKLLSTELGPEGEIWVSLSNLSGALRKLSDQLANA